MIWCGGFTNIKTNSSTDLPKKYNVNKLVYFEETGDVRKRANARKRNQEMAP